jgi:uncharacterized protein YkuJ
MAMHHIVYNARSRDSIRKSNTCVETTAFHQIEQDNNTFTMVKSQQQEAYMAEDADMMGFSEPSVAEIVADKSRMSE